MQPNLTQPPMSGDETIAAPTTLPPLSPDLPTAESDPAPITDTPPKSKLNNGGIMLPKALMDDLYREARKNFALIPDMTFAIAAGARELRDMWEHKDGKFTRKDRPFANYIPPSDDEHGASLPQTNPESPAIAAARARWNEAKREGHADRMTRAANDLLRAVEAEGGATRDRVSSVDEVLAPGRARSPSAAAEESGVLLSDSELTSAANIVGRASTQDRRGMIEAFGERFGGAEANRLRRRLRNPPDDPEAARLETLELDAETASRSKTRPAGLEEWWNQLWDGTTKRPWEDAPNAPWFVSRAERTGRTWANQAFFKINDREFWLMNGPDQEMLLVGANYLIGTFSGEGTDPVFTNAGSSFLVDIRRYGSFRNDPNGAGLILVDENGRDVTFRGKPRVFGWDELYAYGKLSKRLSDSQWLRDHFRKSIRETEQKPEYQAAAGIYDAVKELLALPEDLQGVSPGQRFADKFLPEIPRDNSPGGQTVRDFARFLAGFVPIARGMKAAGWTLDGIKGAANGIAAGAFADFLTAPVNGERPVNTLWRALRLPDTLLNDYLEGRASDSALEARLKNAVNGGLLSAASAGVITVLARATRAATRTVSRAARRLSDEVDDAVEKGTDIPYGSEFYPEPFPTVVPSSGRPMGPGRTRVEIEFRAAQKNWSMADQYVRAPANQRQLAQFAKAILKQRRDATFVDPGIKGRAQAGKKQLRYEYQDGAEFTDIVRGGFVVQHPKTADEIVDMLASQYDIIDKGWVRQPNGYIDRKVLVRFADGQVGEVQFWSPRLYEAAKKTRPLYERTRDPRTPRHDIAALNRQTEVIISAALAGETGEWKQFLGLATRQKREPRLVKRKR